MPKVNLYLPETAYEILIRYKSNTGEKRQQIFGKSAIKRMKKEETVLPFQFDIDSPIQRNGEFIR